MTNYATISLLTLVKPSDPCVESKLCGRENNKYPEVFTKFLLLTHELAAYKR